MISLLPIHRVLTIVATIYAATLLFIAGIRWQSSPSLLDAASTAFAGATVLNAALLGIIYFAWERIWKVFPILNTILFPNLNGSWTMKINWVGADGSGIVDADVTIKQNFVRISMEVNSERSSSETMIAHPKKDPESGTPVLYYIYRVIPKQTDVSSGAPYQGAAILKFSGAGAGELRGNYFTSRPSKGHFIITRKPDIPA